MKKIILALILCLGALPAQAATDFSNWAVMIVAGDNHSHSGAHSEVFDNARRDLARAFAGIGFKPGNIIQFSSSPAKDAEEAEAKAIANGLWDVTKRAPAGCLIYYTSHGTPPGVPGQTGGVVMNGKIMTPDNWAPLVNNACGNKPSVVVISACYSGQFTPSLKNANRMVLAAARFDRTSFGCGDDDHYTFFDGCFLEAMPYSMGFPDLAFKTRDCVQHMEAQLGVDYPSDPQLSLGPNVVKALDWK